jgi:integrase/recombinase XerC
MLDLDMHDRSIQVLGKGNKSRIIPVGGKAFASIQLWINERSKIKNCEESAFLFLNQKGAKLTNRAIQYRLKYWAEKNNIPENIHPHLLRHSFASHVLQSSQDLRAVQELLGHSNISTTQIYTHLDFQHLAKIYDQSHPRSKKKMD